MADNFAEYPTPHIKETKKAAKPSKTAASKRIPKEVRVNKKAKVETRWVSEVHCNKSKVDANGNKIGFGSFYLR